MSKNARKLEMGPANIYLSTSPFNEDPYNTLDGEIDVGYLGDEVMFQVTTESGNLTGAQAGNIPLDKIVIGGSVKVVIPFKEISLQNFQLGVPSARITTVGAQSRVDFIVAVGQSMRRTMAKQMRITKLTGTSESGQIESTDPADTIIIPEISPAEGEVNFPFAPTTQRVIMTNWYAWPHPDTGRWAFIGDEYPA